jgi:predicted dehydrogenase
MPLDPHAAKLIERLGRRLRLGMVGGGVDSVIGGTHRFAFRVDGLYELVAGAMSIDPQIALATGRADLLDPQRTYTDYAEMARREVEREDGVEVVVIATPPQTHLEIAETFLAHGIDVICEKPLTRTTAEAERLAEHVAESGRLLLLTHCYTGYPMVREARALVRAGARGRSARSGSSRASSPAASAAWRSSRRTRRNGTGASGAARWGRRSCSARSARTCTTSRAT